MIALSDILSLATAIVGTTAALATILTQLRAIARNKTITIKIDGREVKVGGNVTAQDAEKIIDAVIKQRVTVETNKTEAKTTPDVKL